MIIAVGVLGAVGVLALIWVGTAYAANCDPFWWGRGPRIYLVNYWGEISKSRLRQGDRGPWAWVHPAEKVGFVTLVDDGHATETSEVNYILGWSRDLIGARKLALKAPYKR